MSKTKKIECKLLRDEAGWFKLSFYDREISKACPALCKGLRPGQSRKLILTQTKNGIKLERAEK